MRIFSVLVPFHLHDFPALALNRYKNYLRFCLLSCIGYIRSEEAIREIVCFFQSILTTAAAVGRSDIFIESDNADK